MNKQFSRTLSLLGQDNFDKLSGKKVIVFGAGGVGAAAIVALARMGLKEISFVDFDTVDISNLNRQIFTDYSNIGQYKCLALRDYIKTFNNQIKINYFIKKVLRDFEDFELENYDYVVDAIDLISAKINLIEICYNKGINIISSMGAGNRIDPGKIKIKDIFSTSYDPLAKVLRHELKKRGVKKLKVVCSEEQTLVKSVRVDGKNKSTPSSISYIPQAFGLFIAGEISKHFLTVKGSD